MYWSYHIFLQEKSDWTNLVVLIIREISESIRKLVDVECLMSRGYIYGLDRQDITCEEIHIYHAYSLTNKQKNILLDLIVKSSWNFIKLFYKFYFIKGSTISKVWNIFKYKMLFLFFKNIFLFNFRS